MTRVKTAALVTAVLLVLAAGSAPARADEAKSAINAAMVLSIFSQPASQATELSGRALGRALLEPGPPPAAFGGGEVQPDGSVKYGNVTVTVRNPCPPGDPFHEPPPLPGRRARQ
jgi:hypothetical protein